VFLSLYKLVWILFFPVVIAYFLKRSIKEPLYRAHFRERIGMGPIFDKEAIWIHAVSLGEFRAAVPLIKKILTNNEQIILTTITPAGREEAQRSLARQISEGRVLVVYLPLEYTICFRFFINRYRPKLGIILEYELWPVLISSCQKFGIRLVLAQAQYVQKTFNRDKKIPWIRSALLKGFSLILAKSEVHAERFRVFTDSPVEVMGELRFEQLAEIKHLRKAKDFIHQLNLQQPLRTSFCFGSTGPGEDKDLIDVMVKLKEKAYQKGKPSPFFIYVPRHKKDFGLIKNIIDASGLKFFSRSESFAIDLSMIRNRVTALHEFDGLYGDSLGEIYFYFQLADFVFIGNSFNQLGSHNIIEPLSLKKTVFVGPSVWGIEYPFVEAERAGVVTRVNSKDELIRSWWRKINPRNENKTTEQKKIARFYKEHSGASEKCISKLNYHGLL
jgi:3-deoxy-D-manno-octulosonic-acid transferase